MMARLTDEQWACVRADYEANGLTYTELESKYGINKSNISRRAAKESWNQDETQQLISASVCNEKEKILLTQQTQQLTQQTQQTMAMQVYDRLRFEVQNNDDMAAVRDRVMEMLPIIETPQQAKQIMETLRIQRESILGKQPDTAIQVNNNVSTISDKDEFRQVALEVLQMV